MARRFARSPATALGLAIGLAFCAGILLSAGLAVAQSKTIPGKASAARTVAGTPSAGRVLLAWGVGGVLTADGTLWQYRPEKGRWVTIDESFGMDGEQRRVLPLPVAAHDVQFMQGFGFLVTKGGGAWLYDLDQDRWRNIGIPGR